MTTIKRLTNTRNTCYMNTCIQVLRYTPKINEELIKKYKTDNYSKEKIDHKIFEMWCELFKVMDTKTDNVSTLNPNRFSDTIDMVFKSKGIDLFVSGIQNDTHEFWVFLIDSFHETLAKKVKMDITIDENMEKSFINLCGIKVNTMLKERFENSFSNVWNMTYAVQISTLTSVNSREIISYNVDPFSIISLSLIDKKDLNLYNLIDEYTKPELLDGDNMVTNEKTNQKEAVYKAMRFWSLPNILVFDIKRISFITGRKSNVLIDFPQLLDMSAYVDGYNPNQYQYKLYAVCNHFGTINGGHYTAIIDIPEDGWVHFDDTRLSKIESFKDIINEHVYCLFYQKI